MIVVRLVLKKSAAALRAAMLALGFVVLAGCATYRAQPLAQTELDGTGFKSRSLTDTGLMAFLKANRGTERASLPAWNLDDLVLAAFYYHPDLAVARADWALARAAAVTAGQRPNPSVNVAPEYDFTTPPPWIYGFTFDIPIETAGKRGYREAQAEQLSDSARWKLVNALWQVRSGVRASLLDLFAARETASLLAQQEATQAKVVALLEGQAEAGTISGFEVTQARIALNTTRLTLDDARRQNAEARAKLAASLGLPVQALDGIQFSFAGLDTFPPRVSAPEVRTQAIVNRADIRSMLAEYAAAQSALQLEIAKQYPDVNLGPGYLRDQADNKWGLALTMSLPILNQNEGPIAEAEAKRQQAGARFLAVQASAIGGIDLALAGHQAAERQSATAALLLRDLQQRLDSVHAMQQAGEAEPLAVANAQSEFNTGALSRLNALISAQKAFGRLEDAVESPLVLPDEVVQHAQQAPRP
jgi:outer membrane protein, heavy metal efflux system